VRFKLDGNTIVPGDLAGGQLTAVSGDVATGRVTNTTDPGFTPLGRITLTIDASDDVINSPVLGDFCGASAPAGTCGA
jgi:hypothetical protein